MKSQKSVKTLGLVMGILLASTVFTSIGKADPPAARSRTTATRIVAMPGVQQRPLTPAQLKAYSIGPDEAYVTSKKEDAQFNSRRLLRLHQLWNMHLFRSEQEERDLRGQIESMQLAALQTATDEEVAKAALENRKPAERREIMKAVAAQDPDEVKKLRRQADAKRTANDAVRAESDVTRVHVLKASEPVAEVSKAIKANADILAKRLQAEIAAGGDNGEKAKANLTYLRTVLLRNLENREYFGVAAVAFGREFKKTLGTGVAQ